MFLATKDAALHFSFVSRVSVSVHQTFPGLSWRLAPLGGAAPCQCRTRFRWLCILWEGGLLKAFFKVSGSNPSSRGGLSKLINLAHAEEERLRQGDQKWASCDTVLRAQSVGRPHRPVELVWLSGLWTFSFGAFGSLAPAWLGGW